MVKDKLRVGVVGYSAGTFDIYKGKLALSQLLEEVQRVVPEGAMEIVSGYTDVGVPHLAYLYAESKQLPTVGFSSREALQGKFPLYPVSRVIIVGDYFGDESVAFVHYIDVLVRIGGGAQSKREVALFQQLHPVHYSHPILFEADI